MASSAFLPGARTAKGRGEKSLEESAVRAGETPGSQGLDQTTPWCRGPLGGTRSEAKGQDEKMNDIFARDLFLISCKHILLITKARPSCQPGAFQQFPENTSEVTPSKAQTPEFQTDASRPVAGPALPVGCGEAVDSQPQRKGLRRRPRRPVHWSPGLDPEWTQEGPGCPVRDLRTPRLRALWVAVEEVGGLTSGASDLASSPPHQPLLKKSAGSTMARGLNPEGQRSPQTSPSLLTLGVGPCSRNRDSPCSPWDTWGMAGKSKCL